MILYDNDTIENCENFFKENNNLRNIIFKELNIKDSIDTKYLTIKYRKKNHKIDLTKINKASQGRIRKLDFNCKDINSLLDGKISTNKFSVWIEITTGNILIRNGHHRLSWLKLLALNNIIDKYIYVENVSFYNYEKKIKCINYWIDKNELKNYMSYITIKLDDDDNIYYKFNNKSYTEKKILFIDFELERKRLKYDYLVQSLMYLNKKVLFVKKKIQNLSS